MAAWLTLASYFFYGWWNPYYLFLVIYSTVLDFCLVALMDHCPRDGEKVDVLGRLTRLRFDDRVLKVAFLGSVLGGAGHPCPGAGRARRPCGPRWRAWACSCCSWAWARCYSSRQIWLLISLVNNLALLLFFKYARFVVENLNAIFCVGASASQAAGSLRRSCRSAFSTCCPVGISFFTFQSLSYTIDFYLGKVHRERNFLRFATFVCFFPQLMAGPIERARHLLPQFHQFPPVRLQNFTDGASLFLVGLFKKLALANYLRFYVERVYDNPRRFRRAGADPGHGCVRLADLLRLQRLHRHGPRRGQADGVQPDPELQQSLPGDRPGRILVALAHQPVDAGSGTTSTSRWAATGTARSPLTAISSSRSSSPASGTGPTGRS